MVTSSRGIVSFDVAQMSDLLPAAGRDRPEHAHRLIRHGRRANVNANSRHGNSRTMSHSMSGRRAHRREDTRQQKRNLPALFLAEVRFHLGAEVRAGQRIAGSSVFRDISGVVRKQANRVESPSLQPAGLGVKWRRNCIRLRAIVGNRIKTLQIQRFVRRRTCQECPSPASRSGELVMLVKS